MRHELQDAFFRALFIGVNSPYLQLEVRRDHAIRDTLIQLDNKNTHELRKQLRVTFVGEEGIDEGGVQKEFFQVIVKEMLSEKYGMFQVQEDTRLNWFSRGDTPDEETIKEYNLVGRLLGLAIYNGVILDINFPLAIYKKFLLYTPEFSDLKEIDPQLAQGLELLLEFDGDVAEVFQRTFQIEFTTSSGETTQFDLKPDGETIPVTAENRKGLTISYT